MTPPPPASSPLSRADSAAGAPAFEQWLRWEERANLRGFRTSTAPVAVSVAEVSRARLTLLVAPDAPPALVGRFLRSERVLWPRHPLNTDASVAFADVPAVETWTARFTSSRTLVFASRPPHFSLKLPTDHPHPDFVQPEKTRLAAEVADALARARRVARTDRALGHDPRLVVVREVLGAVACGSESGFLVRDLSPLADGSYWLPGLSVPFRGRAIARAHGASFEEFWARHYAEPVGRAKAKLLLRYGLEYETPNPQNLLVQLDARLAPTGAIALRDLGDTDPIVDDAPGGALGWTRLLRDLRPETHNSFWAFDEAAEDSVLPETLADWRARHDRAYLEEIARQLGLGEAPTTFGEASDFLRSPRAERSLALVFARGSRARRRSGPGRDGSRRRGHARGPRRAPGACTPPGSKETRRASDPDD